jgi:serine phosphatase RsbU (regulator of sigma subunit)
MIGPKQTVMGTSAGVVGTRQRTPLLRGAYLDPAQLWLVLCTGWLIAVVAADIALDHPDRPPVILVGLLIGGPLLASVRLDVGRTALVGAASAVAAAVLWRLNEMPVDADLAARAAALGWACGFGVLAARRRTHLQALSEERRLSAARAEFLAEATTLLVSSLDYAQTLSNVARAAVPSLVDWCAVDLVEAGAIRRVAVAHADASKERFGWELSERYPPQLSDEHGIAEIIRSCRGQLLPLIDDAILEAGARDAEHLRLSRELGLGSAMAVPIIWQDRAIGAITFVNSRGSRPLSAEDFTLAIDLAARAARAIEHARVHGERDHIARTLQAALLPPALPLAPGLELAARYRPARGAADVGGDFYDCFPLSGGEWVALVGDVQGKGVEAAAVASLIHHSLRTISMQERSPARMLERLNDVVVRRREGCRGRFCTLALVKLRVRGDGTVKASVALAGHAQPLVRRREGTVEAVGTHGTLIGAVPSVEVHDTDFILDEGDVLLLFSDGVTESRRGGRLLGENGLAELLAAADSSVAERLCAHVEHAVLNPQTGEPSDDVAVLAVRAGTATQRPRAHAGLGS